MLNALLVIAALLIMTRLVRQLERRDIVVQWTPAGTKPAMQVLGPTGRLYANQMADHPYARHSSSLKTQSQIMLTLIRQER